MIYLDNNATTKIDPRVLEVMMPYLTDNFANASSTHKFGLGVNKAVTDARNAVSTLLGCETHELFFTSGATESINLALKGIFLEKGERNHFVTVTTEHPAVLDTCRLLQSLGAKVTYISVGGDGLIDMEELKTAVNDKTAVVSTMFVNNETGVIQPIKKIAEVAHAAGAYFMTDATQAVGRIPCKIDELGIDILCFSGHKFYGPKGVGGIFVRQRRPFRVKLQPLLHGGGHERGVRSGTLNVPGIIGIGKACEIALDEMEIVQKQIEPLRNYLEQELLKIENTCVNGHSGDRIYNTSNIRFEGIDSDALIMGLDEISVSNGSACTAQSIEPSHVLMAMGQSEEQAFSAIRFSLGKFTSRDEVDYTLSAIKTAIIKLRTMMQA